MFIREHARKHSMLSTKAQGFLSGSKLFLVPLISPINKDSRKRIRYISLERVKLFPCSSQLTQFQTIFLI